MRVGRFFIFIFFFVSVPHIRLQPDVHIIDPAWIKKKKKKQNKKPFLFKNVNIV